MGMTVTAVRSAPERSKQIEGRTYLFSGLLWSFTHSDSLSHSLTLTCVCTTHVFTTHVFTTYSFTQRIVMRVLTLSTVKVDAERGTELRRLPRVLAVQLKRFRFDMRLSQRYKVSASVI